MRRAHATLATSASSGLDVERFAETRAHVLRLDLSLRELNVKRRADRNDGQIAASIEPDTFLGKGPTTHDRHHQVNDHDVRHQFSQPVEGSGTVGCFADQVAFANEQVNK
jgi:hypothetical protein